MEETKLEENSLPISILVVDDEMSLRGIVSEVLADQGYKTDEAENGAVALEKVKNGNYDVVISDIRMPEMSGIELLEAIKEYDQTIEVIMMTSYASTDTAIKAIRLGAYDYLTKPFEDLSIIPTVINRTVEKLRLEQEVTKLVHALQTRNQEIHDLYNYTSRLFSTLDFSEITKMSVEALSALSHGARVTYYQYDPAKAQIFPLHDSDPSSELIKNPDQHVIAMPDATDEAYATKVNQDTDLKLKIAGDREESAVFLCPLTIERNLNGIFSIVASNGIIAPDVRNILLQYAGNASVHAEKAKLHERIHAMAIKDGLTGLFNHRHFQDTLEQEIQRAKRYEKKVSLILFDIDHFKKYNDTHGHPAGDYLLKEVSALVRDSSRNIDMAARYGGEEFVLILAETDKTGAGTKAENLRKLIEETKFDNEQTQPMGKITVSVGYAEFPSDADSKDALVKAADEALYRAKEESRNAVRPAKPLGE